jgi:hypothetical protein
MMAQGQAYQGPGDFTDGEVGSRLTICIEGLHVHTERLVVSPRPSAEVELCDKTCEKIPPDRKKGVNWTPEVLARFQSEVGKGRFQL